MARWRSWGPPFAVLLPLLQLIIAWVSITPELVTYVSLINSPHTRTLDDKLVAGDLTFNQVVELARKMPKRRFPDRLHTISIIEMPGLFGEMVTSIRTWPEGWYPKSGPFADFWVWRSFSWPIFTLPLWWMAGRSLDSLRASPRNFRPRIRTSEMIALAMVGLMMLILGIGMFFNFDRDDDDGL